MNGPELIFVSPMNTLDSSRTRVMKMGKTKVCRFDRDPDTTHADPLPFQIKR